MARRIVLLTALVASICVQVNSLKGGNSKEPPVNPTVKRTVDLSHTGEQTGNSLYVENLQSGMEENLIELGYESLSSYGLSQDGEVISVKNFMICMQIWIHFFTQTGTPYFYRVKNNGEDQELMLNVKPHGVYFSLLGKEFTVERQIQPAKWYELCFVRNTNGIIIIWEQMKIESMSQETGSLPFNGLLVIGNYEDFRNDTTKKHNFVGKLSNLYALLSNEYILVDEQGFNLCDPNPKKHELSIPIANLPWIKIGSNASYSDFNPCTEKTKSLDIVLPHTTTFINARSLCQHLDLELPVIETESRNDELAELLKQSYDVCTMSLSNHKIGWILNDLKDRDILDSNKSNGEFKSENLLASDQQNQYSNMSNYRKNNVVLISSKMWKSQEPEAKACPICTGKQFQVEFRLSGLCSHNSSSILFYPRIDENTKDIYFHSNIDVVMKITSSSWIIKKLTNSKTIATLTDNHILPIGRREWKVNYLIANCDYFDSSDLIQNIFAVENEKEVTNSLRTLTFSRCPEDNFVCNDGSCIDKSKRCSRKYDCSDKSDEFQCERIDTQSFQYYDQMVVPNKDSLAIEFNATLLKIGSVDIVSQHASIQIKVTMQWEENRLDFLNVQDNMMLNYIRPSAIWTPILRLINKDELEGHVEPNILMFIRKIAESKFFNGYDNVFKGNETRIYREIIYTSKVNCIFSFHFYPFDTQSCLLEFIIPNTPANFLEINVTNTNKDSIEQQVPLEYALSGTKIWYDEDVEKIFYEFKLTRYLMFPFLSIYVPTFMMLLISYGTLWIPEDDFQDRGTMSLTTLLVLISQYTQTLNNLPVTVYVKIVDWWYLFCVLYLSVIIFVHLMTSNVNKIMKPTKRQIPGNRAILKWSRKIFLAILVVFQSVYWLIIGLYLSLQYVSE